MATERPTEAEPATLESAGFVHLVAGPDGDRLAAAGLLGRAFDALGVPFQVSVGRTRQERTARLERLQDDDVGVLIGGAPASDAVTVSPESGTATLGAASLVEGLGVDADPALALAGAVAAGHDPGDDPLAPYREQLSIASEPGLAIPVTEPVEGLAHSARIHAPWSGDPEAVRDALAPLPAEPRDLASLVAIELAAAPASTPETADAIDRLCGRYVLPTGPFQTVGGYADVLEATARQAPGVGVALALGHETVEPALAAWRSHAEVVHGALAGAKRRQDGDCLVLEIETDQVDRVARLAAIQWAPIAVAVGPRSAAIAAREELPAGVLESVGDALDTPVTVDTAPCGRVGQLVAEDALAPDTVQAAVSEVVAS